MRRVRGFRGRVERERSLYPKRGLGLWVKSGATGTTWREPGENKSLTVTVLVGLWAIELRASWKSLEAHEVREYEEIMREQAEYNRRRDAEDALRSEGET